MDLEAKMAAALNGKFFWEPTTLSQTIECSDTMAIRQAQEEFSKGAKHVITARRMPDLKVNAIKKPKNVFRGIDKSVIPVLEAVSYAYDISVDDLLGKSTSPEFKRAKNHLYWSLHKYLNVSYGQLGRMLGKCHTTIIHGKKVFDENLNPEKIAEVEKYMEEKRAKGV